MQELMTPDKANLTPASPRSAAGAPSMPAGNTKPYLPSTGVFDPIVPSGSSAQNAAANSAASVTAVSALKKGVVQASQIKGVIGVAAGGTGVNLQNTGGQGQVMQQTAPGGAVSVGRLSFAAISGTLAPTQFPQTLTTENLTVTGTSVAGTGSNLVLGNTLGTVPTGSSYVSSPASLTTGPATPKTIVNYLQIFIGSTSYWIALFQ